MKRALLLLTMAVSACTTPSGEPPTGYFNAEKFTGLVGMGSQGSNEKLDYILESPGGGELHFASCVDVAGTQEERVVPHQFQLFRLLNYNCKALELYRAGQPAEISHFPNGMSFEFIKQLPATAVPDLGGQTLEGRTGTLGQREDLTLVSEQPNDVRVVFDAMDINYVLMARRDLDGDGLEDLLVRLDWAITDAFGDGFDLLMLSRLSEHGPITISQR